MTPPLVLAFLLAQAVTPHPAREAAGYARAEAPRQWDLPRDHRAHPEFALEWWYLTGHVEDETGRRYGYQATFFRSAPAVQPLARSSPFATEEVVMWHGAVTDLSEGSFAHDELVARGAAGWASASDQSLDVHAHDNSLHAQGDDRWSLRASAAGWRLDLDYTLDRPPVLHGAQPGLSIKGPEPGQASYYVSRVQLATAGHFTRPDGTRVKVNGRSWFDQEFGSGQLSARQVGWDWFSANLSDGSALMIYLLREEDGSISPTSSGTFVRPDGTFEHLALGDVRVATTARWKSPRSGGDYPAAWTLAVPRLGLELKARASVADQERGVGGSAGPVYWEGACAFEGTRDDAPVRGDGYVELVGYAGPLRLWR